MRSALTVFLLVPTLALAAEDPPPPPPDPPPPTVIYKDRTEIDFDKVDVTVPITRPAVSFVLEVEHRGFNPLIRYRENFDPEMAESIDRVK